MKRILKRLWTELTRVRAIQFISYETEEEINKRIAKEFADKKLAIMTANYQKLMKEKLIPYCRDLELAKSGLLLCDSLLMEQAHAMFLQAKAEGRVDALNRVVGV